MIKRDGAYFVDFAQSTGVVSMFFELLASAYKNLDNFVRFPEESGYK